MPQTSEQSVWVRLFQQLMDVVMIGIAFVTAFEVRLLIRASSFFSSAQSVDGYFGVLVVAVVSWFFFLVVQKSYRADRRMTLSHECRIVVTSAFFATLSLVTASYVLRQELPPRGTTALFVIFGVVLLCLNRVFFHFLRAYLRTEGTLAKTVLIVGAGEKARRFLAAVQAHSEWGVNLVGFVELGSGKAGGQSGDERILGGPEDLAAILHEHPIQEVVFAVPMQQLEQCTDMLALCEQEGVNAVILSDFFSALVAQVETDILYDQPVLIYRTTKHTAWQLLIKRVFDLVFSSVLLVLLAPLMGVIALLIKLQDGGPVLFWQQRVGQFGKTFRFPKFRSMVVDAEAQKESLMAWNEMRGVAFKMRNDPRVTKLGRFLRKYSLDELPQLWCVLKGDMSVVGPRPQVESEARRFESWHRRKLSVKPGLTCLWQISGRSDIRDFDEWVRLDLAYIDNWSLWLDLKILLKTIPTVLLARGAR